MNAIGEIISVSDEIARVKFKRTKACKNCNACPSFSSDELIVEIKNTLNAKIGDRVNIALHERSILKASLLAYGIPLIALIAGAAIGSLFGDIYAAALGILGAVLAFALLRILEPRFKRINDFQPRMICFINDENDIANESDNI